MLGHCNGKQETDAVKVDTMPIFLGLLALLLARRSSMPLLLCPSLKHQAG